MLFVRRMRTRPLPRAVYAGAATLAAALVFIALDAAAERGRVGLAERPQAAAPAPGVQPVAAISSRPSRRIAVVPSRAEPPEDRSDPSEAPRSADELAAEQESALAAESRDAAWAPGAEAELQRAVAESAPPGSRLAGVECRATRCRLEVAHESPDAQRFFLPAVLNEGPFRRGGAAHQPFDPDRPDELRTVVYLAR